MTQAIDPRWQPFLPLATEGRIYVEYNDFVVPEWQDVTFDLIPAPVGRVARPLHNLYVFGRVVFRSNSLARPILKFLAVFVFGTLELQGVNLWTERLVTMTVPQMVQGIASISQGKPGKAAITETLSFSPMRTESLCFTNDIDQKIYRGITNLIWAVQSNDKSLAKLLIYANADLKTSYNEWTALGWAVQNRYFGIIKALIKAGADTHSVKEKLLSKGFNEASGLLRNLERKVNVLKAKSPAEEKHPPTKPLPFKQLEEATTSTETCEAVVRLVTAVRIRIYPLSPEEITQLNKVHENTLVIEHQQDPNIREALRTFKQVIRQKSPNSLSSKPARKQWRTQ